MDLVHSLIFFMKHDISEARSSGK